MKCRKEKIKGTMQNHWILIYRVKELQLNMIFKSDNNC